MKKEIIALAILENLNNEEVNSIVKIIEDLNCEVKLIDSKKSKYEMIQEFGMSVLSKEAHRGIIIDNYGNLPFMVLGKMRGSVVAQISDEHSSHMTSEHNGSNMICLGTEVSSIHSIKRIVNKYVKTPFAAGRHLVRTDMLGEMLTREGEYC